jgi:hypothetical protein
MCEPPNFILFPSKYFKGNANYAICGGYIQLYIFVSFFHFPSSRIIREIRWRSISGSSEFYVDTPNFNADFQCSVSCNLGDLAICVPKYGDSSDQVFVNFFSDIHNYNKNAVLAKRQVTSWLRRDYKFLTKWQERRRMQHSEDHRLKLLLLWYFLHYIRHFYSVSKLSNWLIN